MRILIISKHFPKEQSYWAVGVFKRFKMFVDAIKDINPETKIMLSSGYGRDGKTADIMQYCHAFIQKPFSMKELSAALQDIMQ